MRARVCMCFFVNCFGRTVLCVGIEYRVEVNTDHVGIEYRVEVNTDHVG